MDQHIVITPEVVNRMEEGLLEDPAIVQAKIVDIAAADAAQPDLVVAVCLDPAVQQPAEAALRAARKGLVRKMRDDGGRAVVPRKWSRPSGALPLTPAGQVDEVALRQSLLMDAHAEGPPPSPTSKAPLESLDAKITRIVSAALGTPVDQLVLTRSFAQNGGDSFAAIRVFQILMAENVSLRVPDIMRTETLAELPSLVISRNGPGPAPARQAVAACLELHEVQHVALAEPEDNGVHVASVGV